MNDHHPHPTSTAQRARYNNQHPTTSPGRKLRSANHLPGHARPTGGTKARGCKGGAGSPHHHHPSRVQIRVASRIWLQGQAHRDPGMWTDINISPKLCCCKELSRSQPHLVLCCCHLDSAHGLQGPGCSSVPVVIQESGVRPFQQVNSAISVSKETRSESAVSPLPGSSNMQHKICMPNLLVCKRGRVPQGHLQLRSLSSH